MKDVYTCALNRFIKKKLYQKELAKTDWIEWKNLASLIIPETSIIKSCQKTVKKKNEQIIKAVEHYNGEPELDTLLVVLQRALECYQTYTQLLKTLLTYSSEHSTDFDFTLLPVLEETYRTNSNEITTLSRQLEKIVDSPCHLKQEDLELTEQEIEDKLQFYQPKLEKKKAKSPSSVSSSPSIHESKHKEQIPINNEALTNLQTQLDEHLKQEPEKPEKTSEEYSLWREEFINRSNKGSSSEEKGYWNNQRRLILEYGKWTRRRQQLLKEIQEVGIRGRGLQNDSSQSPQLEAKKDHSPKDHSPKDHSPSIVEQNTQDLTSQACSIQDNDSELLYWKEIETYHKSHKQRQEIRQLSSQLEEENSTLWTEINYQKCVMHYQNTNISDKIDLEMHLSQLKHQKQLMKEILREWDQFTEWYNGLDLLDSDTSTEEGEVITNITAPNIDIPSKTSEVELVSDSSTSPASQPTSQPTTRSKNSSKVSKNLKSNKSKESSTKK